MLNNIILKTVMRQAGLSPLVHIIYNLIINCTFHYNFLRMINAKYNIVPFSYVRFIYDCSFHDKDDLAQEAGNKFNFHLFYYKI